MRARDLADEQERLAMVSMQARIDATLAVQSGVALNVALVDAAARARDLFGAKEAGAVASTQVVLVYAERAAKESS